MGFSSRNVGKSIAHKSTVYEVERIFGTGSPQHVLAHADRQQRRGKSPSMWYKGLKNPTKALQEAKNDRLAHAISSAGRIALENFQTLQTEIFDAMKQSDNVLVANRIVGRGLFGGYVMPRSDAENLLVQTKTLAESDDPSTPHSLFNTRNYPFVSFNTTSEGDIASLFGRIVEVDELLAGGYLLQGIDSAETKKS